MRSEAAQWFQRGASLASGGLAVVGLLWLAFQSINVLTLLFIAVLLGAGLEPAADWLRVHLPVGRAASILLTYAAFIVSAVLLVFVAVPAASEQLSRLSTELPATLDHVRAWTQGLQPAALATSLTALVNAASSHLPSGGPPKPDEIVAAGLAVANAVAALVTLLTLIFFWLTERPRLQRYALAFVPLDRRAGVREGWNDVETRLGLWVRGQLTVMGTVALGTGILYSVLGLPSAPLLGLFAGLAEAIPLVGPLVGAVPALLVAATVSPQLAGIVVVAYLAIQFVEGNILVPTIMRNTIGIPPFMVIASLLIGGELGGIVGAFLAVPVVAAGEAILERLQAREVPIAPGPAETAA